MKGVVIALLVFLATFFVIGVVHADGEGDTGGGNPGADSEDFVLSGDHVGVETSSGNVTLYNGMRIGGSPIIYIWLTYNRTLNTTLGLRNFSHLTQIDCDFELPPGHPDPCNPGS